MSLDYDLSKFRNREVDFPPEPDGSMNSKVHTLIWITIPIGMGDITTHKDADEFWHRADIWQKAIGPQFQIATDTGWKPLLLTKEDVHNARGLHTNASRKTRPQFLKDLFETHVRFQ